MTILTFVGAAIAETVGCYAFWAWARMDAPIWWLLPGLVSLSLFAYLLTFTSAEHAERAYAAYGGAYIATALLWLWTAEGVEPDRWDMLGAALCLIGATVMLAGPRPI